MTTKPGERMPRLVETIANSKVSSGGRANLGLCQAGFAFKTASDQLVYIDPYFSDDPGGFLEHCRELAPQARALLMSPEEEFIFEKRP
jgi:hypothetical protein